MAYATVSAMRLCWESSIASHRVHCAGVVAMGDSAAARRKRGERTEESSREGL